MKTGKGITGLSFHSNRVATAGVAALFHETQAAFNLHELATRLHSSFLTGRFRAPESVKRPSFFRRLHSNSSSYSHFFDDAQEDDDYHDFQGTRVK